MPTHTNLTGHADLVRILSALESQLETQWQDPENIPLASLAECLGYKLQQRKQQPQTQKASQKPQEEKLEIEAAPLKTATFLQLTAYKAVSAPEARSSQSPTNAYTSWRQKPTHRPPRPLLTSWADIAPRLLALISGQAKSRLLDTDKVIESLSRAETLYDLPYFSKRDTQGELQVVIDKSRHLLPFFEDQSHILTHLSKAIPRGGLELTAFNYGKQGDFNSFTKEGKLENYHLPPPYCPVLVLGDLGCLLHGRRSLNFWIKYGQELRAQGSAACLLFPGNLKRLPQEIRGLWTCLSWETYPIQQGPQKDNLLNTLFAILSDAFRIEPGLLRTARRLLPSADAGLESEFWQSPVLSSTSGAAATAIKGHTDPSLLSSKAVAELRPKVINMIRNWRAELAPEIWYTELLSLPNHLQKEMPPEDLEDARAFMREFTAADNGPDDLSPEKAYFQSVFRSLASSHLWNDPVIGQDLLRQEGALNERYDREPVTNFDPVAMPSFGDKEIQTVALSHAGEELCLSLGASITGIPVCTLNSRNLYVSTDELLPWASAAGRDGFGRWADITVKGVVQRLRWCPAGKFIMGSPTGEEGRWKDEAPQTEITFESGFWIFDTPVTQALYEAVMGENPSGFQSEDRPVEQVSWEDAQEFLIKMNEAVPSLSLSLPSEAEWEYACRAGTSGPCYADDVEAIAWYSENSHGETHPVAQKAPNSWGLYDTLGNVDEWCADAWEDSHEGADPEGLPRQATGSVTSDRVVRGGSWNFRAQSCRAAHRYWFAPDVRNYVLGFRPIQSEGQPEGQQGAFPRMPQTKLKPEAKASPAADKGRAASSVTRLRVTEDKKNQMIPIPQAPFVMSTDQARLTIESLSLEALPWAASLGRDCYGLWSDLNFKGVVQRLRWCPAGKFMMGSPTGEEGRWEDEGPQTEITFESGFWIFDTPVTQALYEAVMGENPSKFQSKDRPVEQVSWEDAQEFLIKMNEAVPSLSLSLPSEAQWEYACRAGTKAATWAGPMEIKGHNNAPVLDTIAWYGGNSGVDFELKKGHDSSDWEEKQHEHSRAGTHPVAQKAANPWGLYDTLGNVWEWCADAWKGSHEGADPEGLPRQATDTDETDRVVRGGSWVNRAQFCRAAYRFRFARDYRGNYLGFRPIQSEGQPASSEFQAGSQAQRQRRKRDPRGTS